MMSHIILKLSDDALSTNNRYEKNVNELQTLEFEEAACGVINYAS